MAWIFFVIIGFLLAIAYIIIIHTDILPVIVEAYLFVILLVVEFILLFATLFSLSTSK